MKSVEAAAVQMSVVIPTWNGVALLAECLDTLAGQNWREFETIVVEDGSTDDTAARIERDYPWARLIRHESNRGFCAAVNTGIEHARAPLILLLNNDMTLEPDFLLRLADAANDTATALWAPFVLWRGEPHVIYSAGDLQRLNGRPESIGFRAPRAGFPFQDDVFGVSAGAALYRREVFDTIGAFDERYGIYFSDSDLSFRARLAGFRARFVRDAIACHVGSASLKGHTLKRTRQCYVNHALLLVKNMPARLLLRHAPAVLAERVHQARRMFLAARTEAGAAYAARMLLSAWWEMVCAMPYALSARRAIQRQRRLSTAALEALLTR